MATAGVPLWSTTAASNATADPAVNWAEGMAPSAVNDSSRAMMSSVAKWRDDLYGLTTAGTATALTVTTNSTFASAAAMSGAIFTIIPHTTSGTTPTLAVDGLTARNINISTGVSISSGALLAGTPYLVKYVHASTEFIVLGAVGKNVLSFLDIIGGTQLTAPAVDDTLPIYDLSATDNRRILISDFLKVINSLTEDTTPDSAADYVVTYDASASAVKKVLLQTIPSRLPRGYIDGCIISNGTDATNDINIAAGVCRDSTNTVDITVAAMTGKQLDANWAAGGSAGMRNSAVGIADTTYHIYAVATAAGTQDIYAHTSTTVATVLAALQAESGGSSYIYARRIGSIIRASSTILAFTQNHDEFILTSPPLDVEATNPGTSAVLRTMSVPSGIKVKWQGQANWNGVTNLAYIYLSSPDQTDSAAVGGAAPLNNGGTTVSPSLLIATPNSVWSNTSAQIRSRVSASGASDVLRIVTNGWTDYRGKE